MEFRKTIQKRLGFNLFYLILGIALNVTAIITKSGNTFLSSFGTAMMAVGILQAVKNIRLLRNEDACKRRMIAEKDERNIMLANKARSWAFSLYIVAVGIGVFVMMLMSKFELAQLLAWSVLILIALYWVCYKILEKKN